MEAANILQAVLALVFVIGLIGASSLLYRRFVLEKNIIKGGQKRRLEVSEQLYIDSKRRLVLIKKDESEFLILIGANGETVINTDVPNPPVIELPRSTKIKTGWRRKKS